MKRTLTFKTILALIPLTLLGVLCLSTAAAQCGGAFKKTSSAPSSSMHRAALQPAAYLLDGQDREQTDQAEAALEPIVGLWKIEFSDTSKNYSDKGYAAWHSDFTEFQNSERAPSTGAVCQGVWRKAGHFTYKLNHYALAYGDNLNLTNIIRIRELVTVDPTQKKFTGTFLTQVYDTSHNLLVEFKGPITGQRVTIDSDIDSQ